MTDMKVCLYTKLFMCVYLCVFNEAHYIKKTAQQHVY